MFSGKATFDSVFGPKISGTSLTSANLDLSEKWTRSYAATAYYLPNSKKTNFTVIRVSLTASYHRLIFVRFSRVQQSLVQSSRNIGKGMTSWLLALSLHTGTRNALSMQGRKLSLAQGQSNAIFQFQKRQFSLERPCVSVQSNHLRSQSFPVLVAEMFLIELGYLSSLNFLGLERMSKTISYRVKVLP